MSEETQTSRIIALCPGDSQLERRRALASALGHPDDEKVRYWEKKGEIPPREWQAVIDAGAQLGVLIPKEEFVAHLKVPADIATSDSAGA